MLAEVDLVQVLNEWVCPLVQVPLCLVKDWFSMNERLFLVTCLFEEPLFLFQR